MTIAGIARWTCWLAGIVAFVIVLSSADVGDAAPIVLAAGPIVILGLIPYVGQIGCDALAWRTLLRGLDHRVSWTRLLTIRLATEAVLLSLPGGSFVGESLKPYLLARSNDVPVADTVATIGVKRCLLAFAQAIYLAIALVVGHDLLASCSRSIIGSDALPYLLAGAIAALVIVATGLAMVLAKRSPAARTRRLLEKIPWPRLRDGLEQRRRGFARADEGLVELWRQPRRIALAALLLVCAWLAESIETWLLCRLVGIDLPIANVIAMEATVVFARNIAFFVPAGLGVQDAGYLAFLRAYGVVPHVATAFVLAKRVKELVWTAAGYLILVALDGRPVPRPVGAS